MFKYRVSSLALLLAGMLSVGNAHAQSYPLPPADVDIIGEIRTVQVAPGETLLDIGRNNGVGYEEMRLANPSLDMWAPPPGAEVILPTRYVLPPGPREGIVLNVPEMRLYYYPKPARGEVPRVETYPVSIGRMDWRTPIGDTRVTHKLKDPAWYPPESVKEEARKEGLEVPDVVPPGPDNPIGAFALRLDIPGYLIHSTNNPWGVGMRVTHGCVRMYPEDIEGLYPRVPVDTPVRIINEPYKAGWFAGALYLEAHPLLEEHRAPDGNQLEPALRQVAAALVQMGVRVDHSRLRQVLGRFSGMPEPISREQADWLGNISKR